MEQELALFTEKWQPPFQGIQPYLFKGFSNKETENTTVKLLVTLSDSKLVSMVETPANRRHLTCLLLVLPWVIKEVLTPNPQPKKDDPQYEIVCQTIAFAVKPQYPTLAQILYSTQFIKANLVQYLETLCSELIQQFFPQYAQHCADMLFAYMLHATSEYQLPILTFVRSFLTSKDAPKYLNTFAPILKVILYKMSSEPQIASCAIDIFKLNLEMASNRGDKAHITKDIKSFGPYIPNVAQQLANTLPSNLEQIILLSKSKLPEMEDPVERNKIIKPTFASPINVSPIRPLDLNTSLDISQTGLTLKIRNAVDISGANEASGMVSTFGTYYPPTEPKSHLSMRLGLDTPMPKARPRRTPSAWKPLSKARRSSSSTKPPTK
jgi:hypothetical protein